MNVNVADGGYNAAELYSPLALSRHCVENRLQSLRVDSSAGGRAESEWDGTRWRTGGEVKGKERMEWVASSLASFIRTPRLPVVDWTDPPADLNGLVRFAERPILVSARVPSRSDSAILYF